jgi:hypothetical protein
MYEPKEPAIKPGSPQWHKKQADEMFEQAYKLNTEEEDPFLKGGISEPW